MTQDPLGFSKKLDILEWITVLLLFVMPLWPSYLELSIAGVFTSTPPRLLIGLWFFIGVFVFLVRPSRFFMGMKSIRANKSIVLLVLAFFALRFIGCVLSKQPVESLNIFLRKDVVGHFSLFVIGIFSIRSIRAINFYCIALVIAGGAASCFGIFEYVYEKNPLTSFVSGSSDYALMLTMDKSRDGQFRSQSTFEHPLLFGQFLVFVWVFGLYYLQQLNGLMKRFIQLILQPLYVIGVLVSNTRSTLICFAIEYIVCYGWLMHSVANRIKSISTRILVRFVYSSGAVVVIFVVAPILISIGYGRTEVEKGSAAIRLEMLEKGFEVLSGIFWFGNGIGSGAKLLNFTGAENMVTLDNLYLLYALESGVPSALVFILILILSVRLAWSRGLNFIFIKNSFNNLQKAMGLSLVIFSATALISSLMDVLPFVYATLAMLCWMKRASLMQDRFK